MIAAGVQVALVALLAAGCGSTSPSATPSPGGTDGPGPTSSATGSPGGPAPLVIDTDLGADDYMAIAYLTAQDDYQIRAITVSGTGLAHCLAGETNARDLLNELNQPAVPVACGPEQPLGSGTPFPAEWRSGSDDRYGLGLAQVPGEPTAGAVQTLIEVLATSPQPVTILALGPLTNLGAALQADGRLASRIARLVIMGGAVDVPGNGTPEGGPAAAEWNFVADPTAASVVLAAGIPTVLVPLDATDDVPLTQEFADRLGTSETAGPANLVAELLARSPFLVGADSMWDQLAAVALLDESVVTLDEMRLSVIDTGPEAGRTVRQADGAPVAVATAADAAAFEARFLDGLRAGGPRRTPFEPAGILPALFDGATCAVDAPPDMVAGTYSVTFGNRSTQDTGLVMAHIKEGFEFGDLLDWIEENPEIDEQPPMVDILGFVVAGAGSEARGLVTIPSGTAFPACQAVDAEAGQIVLGQPFEVE